MFGEKWKVGNGPVAGEDFRVHAGLSKDVVDCRGFPPPDEAEERTDRKRSPCSPVVSVSGAAEGMVGGGEQPRRVSATVPFSPWT